MAELLFFSVGVGIFLIALKIVNVVNFRRRKRYKLKRNPLSGKPIEIRAATIAEDMMPLITPLVVEGTTIKIVGCDGCYLYSSKGETLVDGIEAWIGKGARVEYILVDPDRESISKLQELMIKHRSSLKVWNCSRYTLELTDDANFLEDILRKFQTYHPTLIKRPADFAMWIERFHPRQSVFAYDVVFYSPCAFDQHSVQLFNELDKAVQLLTQVGVAVDLTSYEARPKIAA